MLAELTDAKVADQKKKKYPCDSPEQKKIYSERYYSKYPWSKTLNQIQWRCTGNHSYHRRGIKNLITMEELKYLWFRDRAYLMDCPSIDRKKSTEGYTLENCQYIELKENQRKPKLFLGRRKKNG